MHTARRDAESGGDNIRVYSFSSMYFQKGCMKEAQYITRIFMKVIHRIKAF